MSRHRMPYPTLAYETTKSAAYAVQRYIAGLPQARHLYLVPREWSGRDEHRSDYTEWWFLPVRDRSGYRHGRLFLDRVWGPPGRRLPGLLRAGFAVARGFGRQVADMVDPALALDAGWFWYRFLSDSMAGAFDSAMRTLMARTHQSLAIDLTLTYFDRYPEPGSPLEFQGPDDRMTFEVGEAHLGLTVTREGGEILAPLASAQTIRDLALRIEGVQDLTWYWIDVHIYAKAWFGEEAASGIWQAPNLWENALAPWLPWVH